MSDNLCSKSFFQEGINSTHKQDTKPAAPNIKLRHKIYTSTIGIHIMMVLLEMDSSYIWTTIQNSLIHIQFQFVT